MSATMQWPDAMDGSGLDPRFTVDNQSLWELAGAWEDAIDEYLRDQQHAGRINSVETVRKYRRALARHAEDTPDGPVGVSRADVKRTLVRWPHPNTRAVEHSVLVSFYDWMLAEGTRSDNPARQVRRRRNVSPA